jgi:integrase
MQDVGLSTVETRAYLIRRFIVPAWAKRELRSLTTEEIIRWEQAIPARTGVSRRVARDARSLLRTILGDAAAVNPPLIADNPALRPRNRGRRTGRGLERSRQRAWATPLQALLAAERAALLTGRDEDFIMIATMAYTGLRWGETIGLERGQVHQDEIHVEWQLREIRSTFHRLPPKDDSYRRPGWDPNLPVDLPPFLSKLISHQIRAQPGQPCTCATQHGGSGRYVFLGPGGGHYRRSNYAQRVFRPACDGRYEPGASQPARLVIADTSTWPGLPVTTWPAAQPDSASFTPPRRRGIPVLPEGMPVACWLPVKQRLTPPTGSGIVIRPGWLRTGSRDPRRAAPWPCSARNAWAVHPRLGSDERPLADHSGGSLGGLPPWSNSDPSVLTCSATKRPPRTIPGTGHSGRVSGSQAAEDVRENCQSSHYRALSNGPDPRALATTFYSAGLSAGRLRRSSRNTWSMTSAPVVITGRNSRR